MTAGDSRRIAGRLGHPRFLEELMSVETLPGNDLQYYLISFDAQGQERTDDPDGRMSERVTTLLRDEPFTDVFLLSHGWRGDVPSARDQYNRWIAAMLASTADL